MVCNSNNGMVIFYAVIFHNFNKFTINCRTDGEEKRRNLATNGTSLHSSDGYPRIYFNFLVENDIHYLQILSLIVASAVLISVPAIIFDILCCVKAAKSLHNRMFNKLLHAPIKFFNRNPIGKEISSLIIDYKCFTTTFNKIV